MHPDVEGLKAKLKEVLYDCAIEIRATKAALYVLDPAVKKFDLVADFGFRGGVRQSATFNDPLIDRCQRGRTAFIANTVAADPRLSDMMFDSSSERLLAVPLYSRGQLIGVIDMRDKAAQQPFEQSDVSKAQIIAEKILELFAPKNIWNQRFITLAEADPVPSGAVHKLPGGTAAAIATPVAPAKPQLQAQSAVATVPAPAVAEKPARAEPPPALAAKRTEDIVAAARSTTARLAASPAADALSEAAWSAVREVMRSILLLPDAMLVAVAATTAQRQEIVAKRSLSDDALAALNAKLNAWLTRRGEAAGDLKTSVEPASAASAPIGTAELLKIVTAPVASSIRGIYLTVAFGANPDTPTQERLGTMLDQLQLALEGSLSREALQRLRAGAAERLVEPDFTAYPDLRRHSEAVASLARAFAQFIGLSAANIETVTLTALVHDAGMRMLDYDRLYTRRGLTAEELALLREHVFVGAAMVQPVLGDEVARAVLCHHERIDGKGYPHELSGEAIPLASRVLQICDAYVAMTDPATYQPVDSRAEAIATIVRGAGAQFDAELAKKFVQMINRPT